MEVVKKEDIHLFNFASIIEDQEGCMQKALNDFEMSKFCPTPDDRFLLFRMSAFGRKMLQENPTQIFVDGKNIFTKSNHVIGYK